MTQRRRIGVFGGSFDPVHLAHVALARVALAELRLDELRWVPVGQAWQKSRQLASGMQRADMIRLALQDAGCGREHRVDPIELLRDGPSYTEDTLDALQEREPGCEWFLVIGQDQYGRLHTWHGWPRILQLATLAVAARAGEAVHASPEMAAQPHRMQRLPLPAMEVSSTAIRAALAAGTPPAALVPAMLSPGVAGYIARHRLYGAR